MRTIYMLLVVSLIFGTTSDAQIYVTATGSGLKTGTSWSDAINGNDTSTTIGFSQLQILLSTLQTQPIWVAAATYKPEYSSQTVVGNRTFSIPDGQKIYGGFYGIPGSEGDFTQRDSTNMVSPSILQGVNSTATDFASVVTFDGTVTTITANTVLDGFTITAGKNGRNNTLVGAGTGGSGGGFTLLKASPVLKHLKVASNTAILCGGGLVAANNSNPLISNCTFSLNKVTTGSGSGGAIYIDGGSHPVISYSNFTSNAVTVTGNGGAICSYNKTSLPEAALTLQTDSFFNNRSVGGYGGAIYVSDSLNILNGYFANDSAFLAGGAIYSNALATRASLYINNSKFYNNRNTGNASTGGNGGAISWTAKESNITIDSTVFKGNSTFLTGGNAANGGALSVDAFTGPQVVLITNSQFLNNIAKSQGGGVYIVGGTGSPGYTTTILNSVFFRDSAAAGGGLDVNARQMVYVANCVFDSCVSTTSLASSSASAVHSDNWRSDASTTLTSGIYTNCTFVHNNGTAFERQGASGMGLDSVRNCIFLGNVNPASPGANPDFMIYAFTTNQGSVFINNSLFDTTKINLAGASTKFHPGVANITHPNTVLANTFQNPDNGVGVDGIWLTADDGLHELDTAQTVNKGNNGYVDNTIFNGIGDITTDITILAARIQGSIVDMGAYEGIGGTVLPIMLLNFTATAIDNKYVQVNWQTATEKSNTLFIIERSIDGRHWEEIGRRSGAGNSSQLQSYSYVDNNPLSGISFYELKQIDIDGKLSLSPVKSVNLLSLKDNNIMLYPNPVNNILFIKGNNLQSIEIIDQIGKSYVTQKIMSKTSAEINLSLLPAGVYIARIIDNFGNTSIQRIVKN